MTPKPDRTPSAAYTPSDQWRGLYAGRPDEQKLVNSKALAALMARVRTAELLLERWEGHQLHSDDLYRETRRFLDV